jgi:hypothetical protein
MTNNTPQTQTKPNRQPKPNRTIQPPTHNPPPPKSPKPQTHKHTPPHPNQTNPTGVAKFLKPAVAGFLLQKELDYLEGAVSQPKRPFAAIVGGSKVSTKITVIETLLNKVDKLIIGGGMVFTFLKARGLNVGSSLVEVRGGMWVGLTWGCGGRERRKEGRGMGLLIGLDWIGRAGGHRLGHGSESRGEKAEQKERQKSKAPSPSHTHIHTPTQPNPNPENHQEDKLELAKSLEEMAKKKGVKFILPTDVVVADKFAPDANSKVCVGRGL